MTIRPKIVPLGDAALLVQFGDEIDPVTNRRVHALAVMIDNFPPKGVIESVPAYNTLLIQYDPCILTYKDLCEWAHSQLDHVDEPAPEESRLVEVPVQYGGEYGVDLGFVRYSLKMERSETVSIDEEMQTVADYLSLEEMRLEERIKYKISVDPKSSKMEIPPMMIQTLVENGIKHGIAKRTSGGEIFVSTKLENSNLYINIRNIGQIEDDLLKQSNGFGISNTKQRLSLIYGDSQNLKLKTTQMIQFMHK